MSTDHAMKDRAFKKIKYSVVVPVFNEEDSIPPLFYSLKKVMDSLRDSYELVFVDDGSTDSTQSRLSQLCKTGHCLRVVRFDANRGQGKAIEEGFRRAKGKIIISLDGDLQNSPEDIPALVLKIDQGFDLVCGWRYARKERAVKKIKSKIGNFLQRRITGLDLHDMSCTMRAYRKEVVAGIAFHSRFDFSMLPYIISKRKKINMAEVKIQGNLRRFGVTKYRFLRTTLGTIHAYIRLLFYYRGGRGGR